MWARSCTFRPTLRATAPADVVQQAVGALGRIDVLVNNVGIAYIADFEELADSDWDELWQLNVMSYVRTIRAVLPAMRERRDGAIVNVSWSAGKRPSTGMPNYSVTNAAVLSLSRLVADLYARDGVRCNAVAPGPTASRSSSSGKIVTRSARPGADTYGSLR